jgi:hypothetical protein
MTQACIALSYRRYSDANVSEGVSQDALDLAARSTKTALKDTSVTIGHRYAQYFQQIINARAMSEDDDWDGDGSPAVSQFAVEAALVVAIALPQSLPVPIVQAEPSGEMSFEWYKDKRHVVVLAVDGQWVRWSAIAGTDTLRTGAEPYLKSVPSAALEVIREVLG